MFCQSSKQISLVLFVVLFLVTKPVYAVKTSKSPTTQADTRSGLKPRISMKGIPPISAGLLTRMALTVKPLPVEVAAAGFAGHSISAQPVVQEVSGTSGGVF